MHTESNSLIMLFSEEMENLLGGITWIENNFAKTVDGIDSSLAVRKIPGLNNSIAEILFHLKQWKKFANEKFQGNAQFDIPDNSAENWTRYQVLHDSQWNDLKDSFITETSKLIRLIENTSESQLQQIVPGRKYNFFHLLIGIIEHDAHHLSQIKLIKTILTHQSASV